MSLLNLFIERVSDPTAPAVPVAADTPGMALIDAMFQHFADMTVRFPTLHGAIEGFHALADSLLPALIGNLPSGDPKAFLDAVLGKLVDLTIGAPILHGFLVVAKLLLGLWLPAVKAKAAVKAAA